jgi:hypothetical protein
MHGDRFDVVTRALSLPGSRRRAIATLAGLLTLVHSGEIHEIRAARTGRCRARCGECQRCDRGPCRRAKSGRERCRAGVCRPGPNGVPCGNGGKQCQQGRCVCPSGTRECGGTCVDLLSDENHCGECNQRCAAGTACLNGACFTTNCASPSPPGNCTGASCSGQTCTPPGTNCGTCDATTEDEIVCINLGPPCEEFQACVRSADCPLGTVCVKSGCCAFAGKPNICVQPV